ncbi:MAG: glycosyltransferase family 4 protein [Acidimicrobiia bacterium]|nr:glycosyltransferase family 4 protein [Acidimicrobiia bacterium]
MAEPLRILMLHNRYLIHGGEDVSTEAQVELLRNAGHEVVLVEESNERVAQIGKARTASRAIWSRESYRRVSGILEESKFDVMHVQNWFPLLSPSVHYAAHRAGVPMVQSLRNFRLVCPQGMLFRDGGVCTDCVGRSVAWPGVRHRCYRNSAPGTAVIATMSTGHRWAGTWNRRVWRYVTPSQYARSIYVDAGWDSTAIEVIPNFIYPDPGEGPGDGGYAVFAGRLDPVKGLDTLLAAWEQGGIEYPLKIAGAGPLKERVAAIATRNRHIEYVGMLDEADYARLVGRASFAVVPTLGIETFGRVAAESLAKGTPAVVADHGGLSEIVSDGQTGLLFPPGDVTALVDRIRSLVADPQRLSAMRKACRRRYEADYSGNRALKAWTALYTEARKQ